MLTEMAGLGIGAGFQIGVLVVQTVLPQDDVPRATASVQLFQAFGGAIFIAVSQTLFQNGLVSGVERDAPGIPPEIFINAGANQVREILARMHREDATTAVLTAYMTGLRYTYYVTLACAGAALVAAATLQWRSVKKMENGVEKKPGEKVAPATVAV